MSNAFTHAFTVGEVVTAATLNGLSPTFSQNNNSTTRALNSIYQNTTSGLIMVTLGTNPSTSNTYTVKCSSTNAPTNVVGWLTNATQGFPMTWIVPPSYYYTVSTSVAGATQYQFWYELNLFAS